MYNTVHGVVDQAGWFISLTDNLVKTEEKLLTGWLLLDPVKYKFILYLLTSL